MGVFGYPTRMPAEGVRWLKHRRGVPKLRVGAPRREWPGATLGLSLAPNPAPQAWPRSAFIMGASNRRFALSLMLVGMSNWNLAMGLGSQGDPVSPSDGG